MKNLDLHPDILCAHAKVKHWRRGHPVYCLKKKEYCVATEFYNTGHSGDDADINLSKMLDCKYRETPKPRK